MTDLLRNGLKPEFLPPLEALRVIAIVAVVLSHINIALEPGDIRLVDQIFSNASSLLIFLSGFLFYHLHRTLPYGQMLGKKFAFIVVPYFVILGVTLIARYQPGTLKWRSLVNTVLVGDPAWGHLWYIPVILFIFVGTPVLLWLMRRGWLVIGPVLVVLFLISVFTYREYLYDWVRGLGTQVPSRLRQWNYLWLVPSRLSHFLFFYVAGMVLARDWRAVVEVLIKPVSIGVGFVATTVLLAAQMVFTTRGQLSLGDLVHLNLENLYSIALLLVLLGVLVLTVKVRRGWVVMWAESSFGVYFLHFPLIYGFKSLGVSPWLTELQVPLLVQFFVMGIGAFFLSLAIVLVLKRLLGRFSRYLVGS